MPNMILVFTHDQFLTYATLYRVPQDIDLDSPAANVQTGGESPKADKPLSPDVGKAVPMSSEPLSSCGTQSSLGPDMALISPTKAATNLDPACDYPNPATAESPKVSPPSPPSRRLGSAGGFQLSGDSSRSQPENQPRQYSRVAKFLAKDLEFIKVGFHIGRFITTMVDIEADRTNI
jgi:hypothetical protein